MSKMILYARTSFVEVKTSYSIVTWPTMKAGFIEFIDSESVKAISLQELRDAFPSINRTALRRIAKHPKVSQNMSKDARTIFYHYNGHEMHIFAMQSMPLKIFGLKDVAGLGYYNCVASLWSNLKAFRKRFPSIALSLPHQSITPRCLCQIYLRTWPRLQGRERLDIWLVSF